MNKPKNDKRPREIARLELELAIMDLHEALSKLRAKKRRMRREDMVRRLAEVKG